MSKLKILLVEDDVNLGFVIKDNFEQNGFDIMLCEDGESAIEIFNINRFDLCILDVMLPKLDGYEVAAHIRAINSSIPILFLTAKSLKEDKIKGFTIGADDYITKPFSIEELMLRCKVFIRRTQQDNVQTNNTLKIGLYLLDVQNQKLFFQNEQKKLTLRETTLLNMLAQNKGNVVKREDILKSVWGNEDYFTGRSMDVFISRLRKYLANDANIEIVNFHSVGFELKIKD